MSDVNHRMSKTLVEKYGKDTLFVLEDLTGVTKYLRFLQGIPRSAVRNAERFAGNTAVTISIYIPARVDISPTMTALVR